MLSRLDSKKGQNLITWYMDDIQNTNTKYSWESWLWTPPLPSAGPVRVNCCICEIDVGVMYVWWWCHVIDHDNNQCISVTLFWYLVVKSSIMWHRQNGEWDTMNAYIIFLTTPDTNTTGSWPGSPQLCFCYADIFIRHIISGREWLWLTNKTSSTSIMIIEITRLLMSTSNDFNTQSSLVFRPEWTSQISCSTVQIFTSVSSDI